MDEHLSTILGLQNAKQSLSDERGCMVTTVIRGDRVGDLANGLQAIYVYCDLLENVPVGDTEAPLLRIVSTNGKSGESVHHTFVVPRYLPLRLVEFDTVEIDIRDVFGKPVPFESGKVYVILHFRRATNPYFIR